MSCGIQHQIKLGKLVCPETRLPLAPVGNGDLLETNDGTHTYHVLSGVPLLLVDSKVASSYVNSSPKMIREYQPEQLAQAKTLLGKIKVFLVQDYRTKAAVNDLKSLFDNQAEDALCLSIGGGPTRPHPALVNLNIGLFPNVDIVADAHQLPYADDTVDAIHCEAVLEHLHDPQRAVREMWRVLKPGGKMFVCTPFMQAYHGYPHHFQNFTSTGHRHLFVMNGFEVTRSGVCVGPVYTMVSLTSTFIHEFAPTMLRWPLQKAWGLVGALLRPLDMLLNTRDNAHILASTTYLVAVKSEIAKTVRT
jgi:SAM-dependent methyltransferase